VSATSGLVDAAQCVIVRVSALPLSDLAVQLAVRSVTANGRTMRAGGDAGSLRMTRLHGHCPLAGVRESHAPRQRPAARSCDTGWLRAVGAGRSQAPRRVTPDQTRKPMPRESPEKIGETDEC
jgi:hypothetical protein